RVALRADVAQQSPAQAPLVNAPTTAGALPGRRRWLLGRALALLFLVRRIVAFRRRLAVDVVHAIQPQQRALGRGQCVVRRSVPVGVHLGAGLCVVGRFGRARRRCATRTGARRRRDDRAQHVEQVDGLHDGLVEAVAARDALGGHRLEEDVARREQARVEDGEQVPLEERGRLFVAEQRLVQVERVLQHTRVEHVLRHDRADDAGGAHQAPQAALVANRQLRPERALHHAQQHLERFDRVRAGEPGRQKLGELPRRRRDRRVVGHHQAELLQLALDLLVEQAAEHAALGQLRRDHRILRIQHVHHQVERGRGRVGRGHQLYRCELAVPYRFERGRQYRLAHHRLRHAAHRRRVIVLRHRRRRRRRLRRCFVLHHVPHRAEKVLHVLVPRAEVQVRIRLRRLQQRVQHKVIEGRLFGAADRRHGLVGRRRTIVRLYDPVQGRHERQQTVAQAATERAQEFALLDVEQDRHPVAVRAPVLLHHLVAEVLLEAARVHHVAAGADVRRRVDARLDVLQLAALVRLLVARQYARALHERGVHHAAAARRQHRLLRAQDAGVALGAGTRLALPAARLPIRAQTDRALGRARRLRLPLHVYVSPAAPRLGGFRCGGGGGGGGGRTFLLLLFLLLALEQLRVRVDEALLHVLKLGEQLRPSHLRHLRPLRLLVALRVQLLLQRRRRTVARSGGLARAGTLVAGAAHLLRRTLLRRLQRLVALDDPAEQITLRFDLAGRIKKRGRASYTCSSGIQH
uniref:Uncharacterized protein n=1 Tax=Anopheles atroparvus TaxID=41427 RepID=A0AAG5DQY2_ANOAO